MEMAAELEIDKIMERPDVVGVIVADPQGFCVASRGKIEPSQSGHVAELCQKASMLAKDPQNLPSILLETSEGKPLSVMIKPLDNVYTGVVLDRHAKS